jgi:hypothetical protein
MGSAGMADKMKGSMMMGGPMAGMQGAKTATNVTPNNGIDRDRYLQEPQKEGETEKPSRHLPLALQLIVEQAHINDALAAVANSRLRIQITQVEWHHATGIKPENEPGSEGDLNRTAPIVMAGMGGGAAPPGMMGSAAMRGGAGGGKLPPMMGGGAMPPGMMGSAMMGGGARPPGGAGGAGGAGGGKLPPMMGSMMGSGMMMPGKIGGAGGGSNLVKSTGPIPGAASSSTGSNGKKTAPKPDDDNLVELTVYGVATLYRLPKSTEKENQNGASGTNAPK